MFIFMVPLQVFAQKRDQELNPVNTFALRNCPGSGLNPVGTAPKGAKI